MPVFAHLTGHFGSLYTNSGVRKRNAKSETNGAIAGITLTKPKIRATFVSADAVCWAGLKFMIPVFVMWRECPRHLHGPGTNSCQE